MFSLPLTRRLPSLLLMPLMIAALSAAPAGAQHITVSIGAAGGVPQADFADQMDRVSFGVTGSALYGFGPVSVGVEGSILSYDRTARPLQADIDWQTAFVGDVTTDSRIGQMHAVLRLQFPEGPVRPYVDGLVGFQHFKTTTIFEQTVLLSGGTSFIGLGPDGIVYTQRTSSVDATDVALSYGVGGGIQLRLVEGMDAGKHYQAFLDLGVRYVLGEEATYRVVGIGEDEGTPVVGFASSRTDILRPQISLLIQFGL